MRLVLLTALGLFLVLGCTRNGRHTNSPTSEAPSMPHAKDEATSPPCATLKCLKEHEGQTVVLHGTYQHPQQKAFAVAELKLEDGTIVVLRTPREGVFTQANHQAPMQVPGRIFTGPIPDSYGIFGRRSDPYLVDVDATAVRVDR